MCEVAIHESAIVAQEKKTHLDLIQLYLLAMVEISMAVSKKSQQLFNNLQATF